MPDFLPTAKIATLKQRALLIEEIRSFFRQQGYWEVQTPVLSRDIVIDQHLEPYVVDSADAAYKNKLLFLQTSPEFAMKRMLAAGADAIFQITPAFRQAERGAYHNPEFCMLEWYRVGDDHHRQIDFVQKLLQHVARFLPTLTPVNATRAATFRQSVDETNFTKLTYDEAFSKFAGTTVLEKDSNALAELAALRNCNVPLSFDSHDTDAWLNLLLAELIEPQLGKTGPVFLYDYPASQAALAKIVRRSDGIAVAERFELYIDGLEICNGYHELTDAEEFQQRMAQQTSAREAAGKPTLPCDNRLLTAMQAGLPDCSGVALGVDRLVMLALGCSHIDEVIAFPSERA